MPVSLCEDFMYLCPEGLKYTDIWTWKYFMNWLESHRIGEKI